MTPDIQRNSLAKFPRLDYSGEMKRTRPLLHRATAVLGATTLLLPVFVHAAESGLTADQLKGVERVEAVTIPIAGEFFAAIDDQDQPHWSKLIRTGTPAATDSRAQIALALGTLVADGYIAVEAQDSQAVKNIGKEIINLAKKLNVSQSVLGRGNSINDFAENNDWNALREELEATQNEVKLSMLEQNDQSLISLVTLGAWVRGTEIVSKLVEDAYSPQSADLLRQPAIIEYLLGQISGLPDSLRQDAVVARLQAGLQKSLSLVQEKVPSEDNVKTLHQTMTGMVQDIAQGVKES